MIKTLSYPAVFLLSAALAAGCATGSTEDSSAADYTAEDCANLRSLIAAQDYAASAYGTTFETDRRAEELRQTSGSPWAGRTRTQDDKKLRDERQAVREAYRSKGCQA